MTAGFSRRGVLGVGAVALGVGVAAGAPSVATGASSSPRGGASASAADLIDTAPAIDPDRPLRSLFTGREGTTYTGSSQWSEQHLVLTELGDLAGGGEDEHRFRVVFLADATARDGIYRLTHGGVHVASIFLARVGEDARLEGIINRSEGAS